MDFEFTNHSNYPLVVMGEDGGIITFDPMEKMVLSGFFKKYCPQYLTVSFTNGYTAFALSDEEWRIVSDALSAAAGWFHPQPEYAPSEYRNICLKIARGLDPYSDDFEFPDDSVLTGTRVLDL